MQHGDLILALDKQQAIYSENALRCTRDKDHGRLTVQLNGTTLICAKCGLQAKAELKSGEV